MRIVLGFAGAFLAMVLIFVLVGFLASYILIFINFSGPESVVEPCFEIGFSISLICSLASGFFICRHFWREFSSSELE
jgi:hypothetical protein